MALPIIDSIVASPSVVPPKGAFVVSIVAHDPDSKFGRLSGQVADAAGNVAQAVVTVQVSDPISFALVDVDAVGFTIVPRAGQPGVFDCVAP